MEIEFENGAEEIVMTKMLVNWSVRKGFELDIGIKPVPFSINERVYYIPMNLKKSVFKPYVLTYVAPMLWSEMGVHVSGQFGDSNMQLRYFVSVVNGLDSCASTDIRGSRQKDDNNNNKFVFGKAEFLPVKELEIGASYAFGKYDNAGNRDIDFIGTHLIITKRPFNLVGEYIISEVEEDSSKYFRYGYYIDAGYKLFANKGFKNLQYLEPVLRYETIDPNYNVEDSFDLERITMGLNIKPYDHFIFRFAYHLREITGPQINNDGFVAQVVIDF